MNDPLLNALAALELLYVVVVSSYLVLQKRSPAATLAWIFGLALVPVVGLPVYWVLGQRRVRRRRLRRLRTRQALARPAFRIQADALCEPATRELAQQVSTIGERASGSGSGVSVACSWEVLVDGSATFSSILEAVRAARDHVHVQYYVFEPDVTGTALRDALVERARAGVAVRLLVDAVGSAALSRRFLQPLRDAGAHVARFHRLRLLHRARFLNFRNHRKIVVCDGRVGFTGGVNVHDDEESKVRPDAWRDTHLRLTGPCVAWLQLVFLEDWGYTCGRPPEGERYFPPPEAAGCEGEAVQILDSGPDGPQETIKITYFAAIAAARRRVLLTTAYFVPDESILLALKTAALRGVQVQLLVPSRSDSRVVVAAARSFYDELLEAGVEVHEYQPRMLHAKTLVVDDWFGAVGTANMDNRSFRLNFEVAAVVYGARVAGALADLFARDLADSRRVTPASRARLSLGARLAEGTARLLAPVL